MNNKPAEQMTGRTYKLAGHLVRIVRIDADTVTFGSAVRDVRLVNSTFTHEQFAQLDLEEAGTPWRTDDAFMSPRKMAR